MSRTFVGAAIGVIALFCACELPLPDLSRPLCTTPLDGAIRIDYCDAGAAGRGGVGDASSGMGGAAGHEHDAGMPASGMGASGAAVGGTGGRGGAGAGGAGQGGAAAVGGGGGGGHAHGGLPVTLPLPTYAPGSKTFDVRPTSDSPAPDAGGIGAARTRCRVSHVNFDDGIVYPGMPGRAHAHQYAGADKSDASGIATDAGGTCRGGTANLSSYWWPALLDPSGRVLTPDWSDHYYKASHYDVSGTVEPPPKGLKIVAGDMNARAAQNTFYLYFACENGSQQGATIPNCGSMRTTMNVLFPQCNDGRLDSPDHKSHMSYPVNRKCPATHPHLLPSISYHLYFSGVPAGSRLSCDAATGAGGYCLHADIVVGWDEIVMRGMVNGCINTGLSCFSHLTGDGRELF